MSQKLEKWKNTGGSFTLADGRVFRHGETIEATEAEIPKPFRDVIKKLAELAPAPTIKRRYDPGLHYDYDIELETQEAGSAVLHSTTSIMSPVPGQLATLAGLKILRGELERQDGWLGEQLKGVEKKFRNAQIMAKREGRALAGWPPVLLADKHRLEARADVCAAELDKVQNLIQKREAPEVAAAQARVLQHGPAGSGKLRDGVLVSIDGQDVKAGGITGTLKIDCKRSPYHGMDVETYRRKVVAPFLAHHRRPLDAAELAIPANDRPPRIGGDPKTWPARP